MAIDSTFSGIRFLTVRAEHDNKAKQEGRQQDGKKKQPQEDPTNPQPVVNEQGQTMGKVIDITA
jgi:hypothetical protein